MEIRTAKLGCMAAAVAAALMHLGAQAQQTQQAPQESAAEAPAAPAAAAPAAAAKSDGLNMERVVVTGTARGSSKMKSSVSISTMDADTIALSAPTSAAEVLRSVPGLRSESSGGEGNANITVRGVPISAGGSRYVQMQEDGLPVLQSGDFNFITPDSYVKIDGTLDHLEVVRGGSASTLASNSPGGIINFISKTGEAKGGNIGISRGLGYDQTRYDFSYGAPLTEKTRFFIGGHYRTGEGIRRTGMSTEEGGQIRGNLTHEFDRGYIRLSFKHLDDKSPTALPVPVQVTNGRISEIPGIDPRTVSFYSPYWVRDVSLAKGNGQVSSNVNDGLAVKSDSFGIALSLDLGNGVTLSENFRKSDNSGRFIGVFPANNGMTGAYTIATGPQKGQPYNGRAFNAVVFNTSIDDAGNTLNDVKLSKTLNLGGGKLTGTAGLYNSLQTLGLTWNFNEYLMQAKADSPALLQTSTAAGATPGLIGPAWGGCCSRAVDMEYKLTSPYVNLGWESGPLNIDASVRKDNQRATGTGNIATGGLRYEAATQQLVNYKVDHTSYSVGGNYQLQRNLALFARGSDGVSFNADRILFGTPLDGSAPISLNTVKQVEGGLKWRQGGASAFLTLFQAKTSESNYEATTRISTANRYDAKGAELEAAWSLGEFRVTGGLTYTDAEITGTAPGQESVIGNTPRRQAKVVYQLAPSYEIGAATIGASIIGTGRSWADDAHTIVMPAYRVVHAFVKYQVNPQTVVSLTANNLFNKLGYTEVEGDGHAARAITGRAIKASLGYSF
ncbi:TonB-dependent receptor domain-containing protein [Pseudoduganella namucuonensis]|uniref:Outer membrane receptor proteins, mostly Fe transport n=1 Tax=Pseudoduganella namucuonensis TaxID=1035707 RepID=A0A1I7LAW2_9BURK|nr:TonB-dependent receptor [Pseudoduganella namucuonensis]SFV06634.1 Outer membrane receptor proteins, mostly Fe transport [Pseudoduganella namucuonensis]